MGKEAIVKVIDSSTPEALAERGTLTGNKTTMTLRQMVEKMKKRNVDECLVLANMIKLKLSKPIMDGYVVVNLKTGKTRKLRQGEFRPMVIDYSDPSFEDGDIVQPKKER